MKNNINERLSALRQIMRREGLAAFVFPSTDPHQGEYVPDHWKGREWISGFDGSAGTAVVTLDSAALWTDSRYFIAAAKQVAETEFVLMKERVAGTPSVSEWLSEKLKAVGGEIVGVDGWVCSHSFVADLKLSLEKMGDYSLRTDFDPLEEIWTDRPSLPMDKVVIQPLKYAGETAASKFQRIRKALQGQGAEGMVVAALDDIAWTLNLRGSDVHCNPVFVSYLVITQHKAILYIDLDKITPEITDYLRAEGVGVAPYHEVLQGMAAYDERNILLDADQLNENIFHADRIEEHIIGKSPIPAMKAVNVESTSKCKITKRV